MKGWVDMLRNWFINPYEKRLRAGWRLILQALLFIAMMVAVNIFLGVLLAVSALTGGENIQDPSVIVGLMETPLVRVIGAVGSLLAIIVSYIVASRWFDKRPWREYGFHFNRKWWGDLVFGLLLGAVLMALVFGAELAAGWITITETLSSAPNISFWAGIAAWLVVFVCVGIYEEMLSRGYQVRNLAEGLNFQFFGPRTALVLAYLGTSIIFGLLHASNPNATLISTFNLVIAGLFLGLGYVLTGELAIPIGLHITWNFFQGNVFGFPVSGTTSPATFIAIQQGGPDLWTGGAFGPEAGIIGLIAIALGSLLTVLWVRRQYGRAGLRDDIAIYTPPASLAAAEAEPGAPAANALSQTATGRSPGQPEDTE